jgi:anti-sigma B factor antagonist
MSETLTFRENDGICIIDIDGDLDSYTANGLRKELESLVSSKNYKIVVNLNNVEHIGSQAIGALVGIYKRVQRMGGNLKVYGLSDNLQHSFDLVGASKLLEIYGSEVDAIYSF